jgi:PPE-repeat protein
MNSRVLPPEIDSTLLYGGAGSGAATDRGIGPGARSSAQEIRKGPVGVCTTGFSASDRVVFASRVLEE